MPALVNASTKLASTFGSACAGIALPSDEAMPTTTRRCLITAQRLTGVGWGGGRRPTLANGALEEWRAVGARSDRSELGRLGRDQARILLRYEPYDIEFRPTLLHHAA